MGSGRKTPTKKLNLPNTIIDIMRNWTAKQKGVIAGFSVIRGIARHANLIFQVVGWSLAVSALRGTVSSARADGNAPTNELAYLGSQPGPRTSAPLPAPAVTAGTTNIEWFGGL